MIDNGILIFAIYNLSGSITEKEVALYFDANEKAFIQIKKAIEADSIEGMLRGGKVNPIFKRNIK